MPLILVTFCWNIFSLDTTPTSVLSHQAGLSCRLIFRNKHPHRKLEVPRGAGFGASRAAGCCAGVQHSPCAALSGVSDDGLSHWPFSQATLGAKNPSASAGGEREPGSIPGLRRSPAGENGNPLQYSCLENSMDRGAWGTI